MYMVTKKAASVVSTQIELYLFKLCIHGIIWKLIS